MKRFAIGAAACLVLTSAVAAVAQSIEVSSLDTRVSSTDTQMAADQNHIVDVSGKRVRLVGPRFYPDSTRDAPLLGRAEALAKEAGRNQIASSQ